MFTAAIVVAIARPGDLGDDDDVAGPGTTTTAVSGTTSTSDAGATTTTAGGDTTTTAAPGTTAPTGTTTPGTTGTTSPTATTTPGSGLGGNGAGQVDGGLADSGGTAAVVPGLILLLAAGALRSAGRLPRHPRHPR